MLPDRVSNPGPLTYESGALPIALRGPAQGTIYFWCNCLLKGLGLVETGALDPNTHMYPSTHYTITFCEYVYFLKTYINPLSANHDCSRQH